jgi:hypothetical protein
MKTIDELTIKEARELASMFGGKSQEGHPYQIGKAYFIRTVTHHYTGRLDAVFDQELLLSDAAWIADDGRFAQAVAEGRFNEIEPFPDNANVVIGRASIIDAVVFDAKLPRSQK